MTKRGKRERRIRENPDNVALRDFEALISTYGHTEPGAKHFKAVIGEHVMTYKRENPVKSVYVRQLLSFIDLTREAGQGKR